MLTKEKSENGKVTICLITSDTWFQVCATCFDLSVSLLRVLEMTVTLVPEIFLDWSRPSAELLLRRLAQVNNQAPPPHLFVSVQLHCRAHIPNHTAPDYYI